MLQHFRPPNPPESVAIASGLAANFQSADSTSSGMPAILEFSELEPARMAVARGPIAVVGGLLGLFDRLVALGHSRQGAATPSWAQSLTRSRLRAPAGPSGKRAAVMLCRPKRRVKPRLAHAPSVHRDPAGVLAGAAAAKPPRGIDCTDGDQQRQRDRRPAGAAARAGERVAQSDCPCWRGDFPRTLAADSPTRLLVTRRC